MSDDTTVQSIIDDHKKGVSASVVNSLIGESSIVVASNWSPSCIVLPEQATDFEYLVKNTFIHYDLVLPMPPYQYIPMLTTLIRAGVLGLDGTCAQQHALRC